LSDDVGQPLVGDLEAEDRVFCREDVGKAHVPHDAALLDPAGGVEHRVCVDLEVDQRARVALVAHEYVQAFGDVCT
jgi:hypothetical protein